MTGLAVRVSIAVPQDWQVMVVRVSSGCIAVFISSFLLSGVTRYRSSGSRNRRRERDRGREALIDGDLHVQTAEDRQTFPSPRPCKRVTPDRFPPANGLKR